MNDPAEHKFLREGLEETSSEKTEVYQLDQQLTDFLNKLLEKYGDIEAIILTLREDKYTGDIAFILPEPKKPLKLPKYKTVPEMNEAIRPFYGARGKNSRR